MNAMKRAGLMGVIGLALGLPLGALVGSNWDEYSMLPLNAAGVTTLANDGWQVYMAQPNSRVVYVKRSRLHF